LAVIRPCEDNARKASPRRLGRPSGPGRSLDIRVLILRSWDPAALRRCRKTPPGPRSTSSSHFGKPAHEIGRGHVASRWCAPTHVPALRPSECATVPSWQRTLFSAATSIGASCVRRRTAHCPALCLKESYLARRSRSDADCRVPECFRPRAKSAQHIVVEEVFSRKGAFSLRRGLISFPAAMRSRKAGLSVPSAIQ